MTRLHTTNPLAQPPCKLSDKELGQLLTHSVVKESNTLPPGGCAALTSCVGGKSHTLRRSGRVGRGSGRGGSFLDAVNDTCDLTKEIPHRIGMLLFSMVWLLLTCQSLRAMDDEQTIDAVKEALGGRAGYPWYDPETDDFKYVDVPNEEPPEIRDWDLPNGQTSPTSFSLTGFWQVLEIMAWLLVGALLLLVGFYLMKTLLNRDNAKFGVDQSVQESAAHAARIEKLPFQVKRPQADLLGEARRHYQQGNFGEAIIYYFSFQLVELDRCHVIRLAKGKTNRQYLRELKTEPNLRSVLEQTIVAFEDVFFGNRSLTRSRFEACWNHLGAFENEVDSLMKQTSNQR